MTKKSHARQAADAAAKEAANLPSYWEDLENLYHAQRHALDNAAQQVNILYKSEGLLDELKKGDPREIAVAVRGLANDYRSLSASLSAIHEKHKSFNKKDISDEHAVLAVEIGGEYEDWRVNYLAAIMPNVEYLIAEINLVLNRVRAQTAANGLAFVKNELSEPTPA